MPTTRQAFEGLGGPGLDAGFEDCVTQDIQALKTAFPELAVALQPSAGVCERLGWVMVFWIRFLERLTSVH